MTMQVTESKNALPIPVCFLPICVFMIKPMMTEPVRRFLFQKIPAYVPHSGSEICILIDEV
jgi:hypothetical protein